MARSPFKRKGNYVIVEKSTGKKIIRGIADKKGQWIIESDKKTMIVDEVAGIFYEINSKVDHTKKSNKLVYVDEEKKCFVEPDFKIKKNINDTVLIVEKDELLGVVDRNGKMLLPIEFVSIDYNKNWKVFIAELKNNKVRRYRPYYKNGKPAMKDLYEAVDITDTQLSAWYMNGTKLVTKVLNRK